MILIEWTWRFRFALTMARLYKIGKSPLGVFKYGWHVSKVYYEPRIRPETECRRLVSEWYD